MADEQKLSFDKIRQMMAEQERREPSARVPEPTLPELPAAPRSIDGTGLSETFLANLTLKILLERGELTGGQLCGELCLPFHGVVQDIVRHLKDQMLLEIRGGTDLNSMNHRVGLLKAGIERAMLERNREGYVGPCPVTLESYRSALASQPVEWSQVTDEKLRTALGDLVLSERTIQKLGPAFNSGRSMFLYGNPGNGKTLVSERMASALGGAMRIPHAIEVGGQVIRYRDGNYHHALTTPREGPPRDDRWIIVERPFVVVGGELQLENLNLTLHEDLKYYVAPVQLKANGGVLLIDDFGRQQVNPVDLLNRWIVPLEKRVDFHTLPTGLQVEIPFQVLIIFSTNLEPRSLVDEAFLRRIRYKIEIGDPTDEQFREIFQNCCRQLSIPFEESGLAHLVQRHYRQAQRRFRAVHPRDLLMQLRDIASYIGADARLTEELIDRAADTYFVEL